MFSNKVCLIIVLVCCFCSMGMAVLTNKLNPIPSFVVGGNPNYDTVNDHYDSNCSQFVDDMDILRQLPFKVLVEPDDGVEANMSIVQLNADMTTVRLILLSGVPLLPSSLFCLSKLDDLTLFNVPLKDNVLPEGVTKLQTLRELSINDVPILKIGDQFSKLRNLSTLVLNNCSLTSLPDLSHLNFIMLSVEHNNLTHFKGSINTEMLNIEDNSFRTLPVLSHPEKIIFLDVSQNPLKTITPVLKYKKLQVLAASDAEITFIPPNIDRLEDLNMIILANNKLTHLPINILNLPELEYLDVRSNLFSSVQIRSIKQTIKKNHPKLEFEI